MSTYHFPLHYINKSIGCYAVITTQTLRAYSFHTSTPTKESWNQDNWLYNLQPVFVAGSYPTVGYKWLQYLIQFIILNGEISEYTPNLKT